MKILSKNYKISYFMDIARNDASMGRSDTKYGAISLSKVMPQDIKEATLFHEIFHILSDELALKLTEEQVTVLGTSFYSVMKDNNYLNKINLK